MRDPKYQNESLILLDYDEATLFLSHDEDGTRRRITTPRMAGVKIYKINGREKCVLADLRRAV